MVPGVIGIFCNYNNQRQQVKHPSMPEQLWMPAVTISPTQNVESFHDHKYLKHKPLADGTHQ